MFPRATASPPLETWWRIFSWLFNHSHPDIGEILPEILPDKERFAANSEYKKVVQLVIPYFYYLNPAYLGTWMVR